MFDKSWLQIWMSGLLFTKQMEVFLQDNVKSSSHGILVKTFPITLKFDSHLGSSAAEMPVKFQSDYDQYNIQSCGIDTSQDLVVRHLTTQWIEALVSHSISVGWCEHMFNCQTSNISHTLLGNKIVYHSDVVGATPVGTAPTTSSFSTQHLASMDWEKTRW